MFLGTAPHARPQLITELKPETVEAFDSYVKAAETRIEQRVSGQRPFLWIDEDPKNRLLTRQGEIVVHQSDSSGASIPNGLIHDWIGSMFVPGGKLEDVVAVMQDVDRHAAIYPEVIESKLLMHEGGFVRSRLKLLKKKVLTVVLATEHEAQYRKLDDQRWYVHSYSTKIVQVRDAGTPDERELPVGKDSGFLWRMNAYWRLEQAGDGVFVELVTVSLTRDVPAGLGWLIKPFIRNIPRESLLSTLQATRLAAGK